MFKAIHIRKLWLDLVRRVVDSASYCSYKLCYEAFHHTAHSKKLSMALFRVGLGLGLVSLLVLLSSTSLCLAHPWFGFWGGGHGGTVGGQFSLFPQFYQFSCPQVDEIIMSVLEKAIARDPRMAASLLRLHFHDCFAQVRVSQEHYRKVVFFKKNNYIILVLR